MNDRSTRIFIGLLACVASMLVTSSVAGGAAPRASGKVSGHISPALIPAEFRGTWTMYLDTCATDGETNITIRAREIAFYEDRGKIVSVRRISPMEIAINMVRGLPRHPLPSRSARLLLSEDRTQLALVEPDDLKAIWRLRCP